MGDDAELDTAPAFAAQAGRSRTGRTSSCSPRASGTCPTFDPATGTFTAGDCANGVPAHGRPAHQPGRDGALLRQPRRSAASRWVQETFACTKFPAEIARDRSDVGGAAPYTGVWPFDSIAGARQRRPHRLPRHVVGDLRELPLDHEPHRAAVRALRRRRHVPDDHRRPDAARRRAAGSDAATTCRPARPPRGASACRSPTCRRSASAMAADPTSPSARVARMWNWALGKTDIVDTLPTCPPRRHRRRRSTRSPAAATS